MKNDKNGNIILCGFMGSGKSTIGYSVAQKTGYDFIDTDNYIEDMTGMKISDIFERYGEDSFREFEHTACKKVSRLKKTIIATGGGALTFERNATLLKSSGTIVFIDVPLFVLLERLKYSKRKRPLLDRPDGKEKAKELYDKRIPMYKAAADIIVNGARAPRLIRNDIIQKAILKE